MIVRAMLAAAALIAPVQIASAQQVTWTLYDLGTLENGEYSRAEGINKFGEIVGVASETGDITGPHRAFAWFTYEDLGLDAGVMYDLNDFANESCNMAVAFDINDDGLICGRSANLLLGCGNIAFALTPAPPGPILWTWADLGMLPQGNTATAYALSEGTPATVVGVWETHDQTACTPPGGGPVSRAAKVSSQGLGLVELMRGNNDGPGLDPNSAALDISGERIGGGYGPCDSAPGLEIGLDAASFEPDVLLQEIDPNREDWGNQVRGVDGDDSVGWGVEEIGTEQPPQPPQHQKRATFWEVVVENVLPFNLGADSTPDDPPWNPVPPIDTVATIANAIASVPSENLVQVVGWNREDGLALLWTREVAGAVWIVTDLTKATDATSPPFNWIKLTEATDINQHGWIVGHGFKDVNGTIETHAFLAVPRFIPPGGGGACEDADLNGDGNVGPDDLAIVLGSWGSCKGCPADLNGDNAVGPADLALLLGVWGPCNPAPYNPFL